MIKQEHVDQLAKALTQGLAGVEHAIRKVARGDNTPGGLEGLTMAIAGDPARDESLAKAVGRVADALSDIAEALKSKS